eukprot:6201154-Pleurochrysis_carterae.AAC.3
MTKHTRRLVLTKRACTCTRACDARAQARLPATTLAYHAFFPVRWDSWIRNLLPSRMIAPRSSVNRAGLLRTERRSCDAHQTTAMCMLRSGRIGTQRPVPPPSHPKCCPAPRLPRPAAAASPRLHQQSPVRSGRAERKRAPSKPAQHSQAPSPWRQGVSPEYTTCTAYMSISGSAHACK